MALKSGSYDNGIVLHISLHSEYSVYQTFFTRGPAGLPICIVNQPPPEHVAIRSIESIGRDGQVKFLLSPGIELAQPQL